MRFSRAFFLVISSALPAPAADPPAITLPKTVQAPAATIVEVKAETAGKAVEWVVLTPGLSAYPVDGGRTLLVSGPSGRYELLAYTAAGDVPSKPARCVVQIGPEPAPPPAPVDALAVKLRREYDADPGEEKRADALQLAALYRQAAKLAADKSIPTSKELLLRVRKAGESLVGPDALVGLRIVVAGELAAALGMSGDQDLTDATRAAAAKTFERLAGILEGF